LKQIHSFIELQTVDSTNLYAERLLKAGKVEEGTVILAREQTSGKGQGENKWESEHGKNATFSLVLFPVFLPPGNQFILNKAISLGVLEFLLGLQPEVKLSIKWPNDIYAGSRKIGGILIRNSVCGNVFESCIAGIGVNVNQDTFSPGLPNPVSLKQITGMDYPVRDAVDIIVAGIDRHYQLLQTGTHEPLDQEYREHLLGINEWRYYSIDKNVIKGRIRDVDESGMLIMELEDGSTRLFNHGEIEFYLL
jgi:BirA family biotin operon repressor/biotin-[acetyl-CoA-carboxylase] ligase